MNMRASLENFTFSHSKTAISFNICWYFRYFVSETFIRSHITSAYIHNQCVSLYYLWYDAIYKRQYTDKALTLGKCMYVRASEASELRKFSHFHILKLLLPSIFCWYFRYFVSETYIFSGVK